MTAPAYLFYSPQFRPLDDDGVIMPSAYLQFYLTGTTTDATIYSDAGLTTPLANPLTADSAGRFVPIYLDPNTTYRVQLYDAGDNLIYDIDPLAPARDYPPGTVVWFYGTQGELEAAYPPALWQILDGNNGAPDGLDRFPVIAGDAYSPGDTGGSIGAVATSAAGAHDHGGSTGSTALTESQMPSHRHRILGTTGGGITDTSVSAANARGIGAVRNNTSEPYVDATSLGDEYVENTGSGTGHTHSITAAANHTHTVSITPPYLALWAVMRRDV